LCRATAAPANALAGGPRHLADLRDIGQLRSLFNRLAGKWFADRSLGGLGTPGDVVWDAYFAFAADARWRSRPSGLLAQAATSSTTPTTSNNASCRSSTHTRIEP
jgi:hypothetical protein